MRPASSSRSPRWGPGSRCSPVSRASGSDVVARVLGASALVALAWFVMARLPFGSDTLAQPLRAGRDLAWSALVGGSGRARRPAYALWLVALAGIGALATEIALGTSHVLWWPLP